MQFIKIEPRPGVYTDGTDYTAEGTWYDVDKVRFRKGFAEKLRGWTKFINDSFIGSCRKIHNWAVNSGSTYLAVGTHLKLYQTDSTGTTGSYVDITPIRANTNLAQIDTLSGSSLIVVTDSAHGVSAGDYVTFSGVSGDLGGITAATLTGEHKISGLGDIDGADPANKYTIQLDGITASSTASGLSGTNAAYQISIGSDEFFETTGWGYSTWSSGPWGGSIGINSPEDSLRQWSLDNYGDDLLATIRFGGIYYWDQSVGGRAKVLNDLTRRVSILSGTAASGLSQNGTTVTVNDNGHGASVGDTVTVSDVPDGQGASGANGVFVVASVPTLNQFTYTASGSGSATNLVATITYSAGTKYCPTSALTALTSERAKHVIAFGCNRIGQSEIDRTLVRWSSAENPAEWQPLTTNSAGGQDLSSGSKIIGALKTRNETVIWTDVGLVSMRYIGSPFYFSFTDVGNGMSMISPNAAANADGVIYFMDRGAFYRYSGAVQRLRCPVLGTVFDNFNYSQSFKVACGTNLDYSEVVWFYPSENSTENDRYVIYNYDEDVWYYGTMSRGTWDNATLRTYPQAVSLNKISPSEFSANPISTTNGSGSITVALPTGHGMPASVTVVMNDFSDAGNITSEMINTQHEATVSGNTLTIDIGTLASSTTTGGGSNGTLWWNNYTYNHEDGWDADGDPITSYIETGDFDLGDGDKYMFLGKIVPDLKFLGDGTPTVNIKLNGKDFPLSSQTQLSNSSFTTNSTQGYIRGRARQVSMRVESSGDDYGWRLGYVRLWVRPDGGR